MNENEILNAILSEVKSINQKVDNLETKVGSLEIKVDSLETRMGIVETRINKIEQDQSRTQITLETIVEKCVDVLGNGYQAVHEKTDRISVDSMNRKITQLEMLEKINRNDIQMLKQKIG